MIVLKKSNADVILGTNGEQAIESALKYFIFHTDNRNALEVLEHLDNGKRR